MNLKNGYKVLYEVIEDSKRVFKASTTGLFENAEDIVSYDIEAFKAVYQDKDHMLYGVSASGEKVYLEELNALFVEAAEEGEEPIAPMSEPEKTEEPKEEDAGEELPEEGSEEV